MKGDWPRIIIKLHFCLLKWPDSDFKEMGIPNHLTCLLRNLYAGQEATVRTGHGRTDLVPNRKRSTSRLLGKTLESPLDCKQIQPVHSKGDQFWDFFGRTDYKAETLILWPPDAKS